MPPKKSIKVIVGLGNPGPRYANTRHNVGFMVVDKLAERFRIGITRSRFSGLWGDVNIGDDRVYLLKPQTYMNRSGQSVGGFIKYFKIPTTSMLVIHDDLDLPLGRIKLVRKGGAGGHRGVKSIMEVLGTNEFNRMKIGIGRPRYNEDIEGYVLSPFYADERKTLSKVLDTAVEGIVLVVREGLERAMNVVNAFKLEDEKKRAE